MVYAIDPELEKRIKAYIDEGRFDSMDEFINQAITLLLYAEDNKDMLVKGLGN